MAKKPEGYETLSTSFPFKKKRTSLSVVRSVQGLHSLTIGLCHLNKMICDLAITQCVVWTAYLIQFPIETKETFINIIIVLASALEQATVSTST